MENLLRNHLHSNSIIIVAVSGGADSVFLLLECIKMATHIGFKIIVAHVDHGLRGKDSKNDAAFVQNLAKKNGLVCETLRINIKELHGNLEEIGRNKRYDFFEKIRNKYDAEWILTAHHQNDNLETMIFNFIRGASYGGLKGIAEIDQKRHLLRPLLHISKKEIISSLKKAHQTFCIDQSNNDLKYSRNLLRHKVIPLLEKINPGLEQTFNENIKNFTEIADFLDAETRAWLKQNFQKNSFPLNTFLEKPRFFQKNILTALYREIYGSTVGLSQAQLNALLHVLEQEKSGRRKEFGGKYFLQIKHSQKGNERSVTLETGEISKKAYRLKKIQK